MHHRGWDTQSDPVCYKIAQRICPCSLPLIPDGMSHNLFPKQPSERSFTASDQDYITEELILSSVIGTICHPGLPHEETTDVGVRNVE